LPQFEGVAFVKLVHIKVVLTPTKECGSLIWKNHDLQFSTIVPS